MRASRRGQNPDTSFNPNGAPGVNGWGEAYDTDNNINNFGRWTSIPDLPLKSSLSPATTVHIGHPATQLFGNINAVQVGDPTSPLGRLRDWKNTDFHHTSLLDLSDIFGPQGIRSGGSGPSTWPTTIAAGPNRTPASFAILSSYFRAGPTYTLLDSTPTISAPPRIGGVDADGITLTGGALFNYPDSETHYAVLSAPGGWGIVGGVVKERGGSEPVLPGVPVRISSTSASPESFLPIEKITDSSGRFSILVPVCNPAIVTVTVNDRNPVPPNTADTHFYDPWHETPPPDPRTPNCRDTLGMGTIYLSPVPANGGGTTARISGLLTAAETNHPRLPGLTVSLRDDQGRILQVVKSSPTPDLGAYTFSNLPAGQFYVVPVLERNEASTPPQRPITLTWGQSLVNQDFVISGVPATIQVNARAPGVFVLVMKNSDTLAGDAPPTYDPNEAPQAYYMKVSGDNRLATLVVAPGQSYKLTCWTPNAQGVFDTSSRGATRPVGGAPLDPMGRYELSCPSSFALDTL